MSKKELFHGLRFWIAQRCPSRTHFIQLVESHGGEVVKLEKQANIMIADHMKKEAPPGSYSYTYIEESVERGRLAALDDHVAGPPEGAVRPVGSIQPAKTGSRKPFTPEDDRLLQQWVEERSPQGAKLMGNQIYQQLEKLHGRHTWQSWRDRYIRCISRQVPAAVTADEDQLPSPETVRQQQSATLPESPGAELQYEAKDMAKSKPGREVPEVSSNSRTGKSYQATAENAGTISPRGIKRRQNSVHMPDHPGNGHGPVHVVTDKSSSPAAQSTEDALRAAGAHGQQSAQVVDPSSGTRKRKRTEQADSLQHGTPELGSSPCRSLNLDRYESKSPESKNIPRLAVRNSSHGVISIGSDDEVPESPSPVEQPEGPDRTKREHAWMHVTEAGGMDSDIAAEESYRLQDDTDLSIVRLESLEPSLPEEITIRLGSPWDTQAILNRQTQVLDFELAEPEGGFPPEPDEVTEESHEQSAKFVDGIESNIAQLATAPRYHGRTTAVKEAKGTNDLDHWIADKVAHGYNETHCVRALKSTSMVVAVAEEVLRDLAAGHGISNDMAGVWTEADDQALDGSDGRAIAKLEQKHGKRSLDARINFRKEWDMADDEEG